jgi:hypothetical protein
VTGVQANTANGRFHVGYERDEVGFFHPRVFSYLSELGSADKTERHELGVLCILSEGIRKIFEELRALGVFLDALIKDDALQLSFSRETPEQLEEDDGIPDTGSTVEINRTHPWKRREKIDRFDACGQQFESRAAGRSGGIVATHSILRRRFIRDRIGRRTLTTERATHEDDTQKRRGGTSHRQAAREKSITAQR